MPSADTRVHNTKMSAPSNINIIMQNSNKWTIIYELYTYLVEKNFAVFPLPPIHRKKFLLLLSPSVNLITTLKFFKKKNPPENKNYIII